MPIGVRLHWIEGKPKLAIMAHPRGGEWLEDEVRSLRAQGVEVLVSLLTAEEVAELDLHDEPRLFLESGGEFYGHGIGDREVPENLAAFDALIESVKGRLLQGKAVVIHCRSGIGRSALFAACLMSRLGHSPEAAFQMIGRARGCSVPDTEQQRRWVERFVRSMTGRRSGDN